MGTAVVLILLCGMVAVIVRKMIMDKKSGKSSCGGNCAGCGMACHQNYKK